VLLRRLLAGKDPVDVRCAIVDALPLTGGDWQEGAAALIAVDARPRSASSWSRSCATPAPHSVHGLRLGFKDEDPEINVAAARTAGFSRHGAELLPELYSSTFDTDWDLRAAAVQALGMLKLPQSRDVLVKALADEEREVRLQALLALEQLDPEGLLELPELDSSPATARATASPARPSCCSRSAAPAQGRRRRAGDGGDTRCHRPRQATPTAAP
jgi:hypothetical protein